MGYCLDNAQFSYSANNQLILVQHSDSRLVDEHYGYHQNGNLASDNRVQYQYNAFDRTTAVTDQHGQVLGHYHYTASGKQMSQIAASQPALHLYYSLGILMHEQQDNVFTKNIIVQGRVLGRVVYNGNQRSIDFSISDNKGSQLVHVDAVQGTKHLLTYTSNGFSADL